MRPTLNLTVAATLCLISIGCSRQAEAPPPSITTAPRVAPPTAAPAPAPRVARATLMGLSGSIVTGDVTFTDTGNGLSIEARVTGLRPGKHGFHVHEVGDCSGDGTAAGDHFNPAATPHGGPDGTTMHAGDMGNIEAGADGTATVTMLSQHMTLEPVGTTGTTGIIGRSVIVHENEDDLSSQPAGNAGARIACGRIEMVSGGDAPAATAPMDGTDMPAATAPMGASAP